MLDSGCEKKRWRTRYYKNIESVRKNDKKMKIVEDRDNDKKREE